MLITKEDLAELWKHLTSEATNGTCSTMIFVANNCDALCACKILTDLLKQSSIQYTCVPVFSYSEIDENLSEEKLSEDIKSLIFLNCAAKLDVNSLWFQEKDLGIKTFIFESQRPLHHNTVLSQKAVYVVDFGDINIAEVPEDDDFEVFEQEMEAEGEDQPVDGEKEYQLITNGGNKNDEEAKLDGEGDDEEFDDDLIGKKRPRDADEEEKNKLDRRKRIERVSTYYEGVYHSKSCAYLAYCLGSQLNKQNVDSFWLWILGLTDQLIHSKISQFEYDDEINGCQKEYLSIAGQDLQHEENVSTNVQKEGVEANFDAKGLFYQNVDLQTDNIKVGSIIPSYEFRFMFMRSWSLYNSVYYSNYVVSKLRLWTDDGKRDLKRFFASLGIPDTEYNQKYSFMTPKFKNALKEKIEGVASSFGLDHIMFSSFVRQIDNKTQMNASDMVYAITSILEAPRAVMIENIPQLEKEQNGKAQEEVEVAQSSNDIHERQVENFWAAYTALDIKHKQYIDYGIVLSKEMQQALMTQGTSILTGKKLLPTSKFWYAVISNDSLTQTKIFQHPMAIQKLASFLAEASRVSKSTGKKLPVVV